MNRMNDLTVLYYTANRIAPHFATAVARAIRLAIGDLPLIVVTRGAPVGGLLDILQPTRCLQAPEIAPSIYQVYCNILSAARAAATPYVACAEDDTCYVPEHFAYRPALDVFAYNQRRAVISRRLSADGRRREAFYYVRPRTQMAMGLCGRELLIETLSEKFAAYPVPPPSTDVAKKAGWGEPGRYERNLKLTPRALERFDWTERYNVTFNHAQSLMGRRRVQPEDAIYTDLPPWGEASAFWERVHG